jgi:hypothetical protein
MADVNTRTISLPAIIDLDALDPLRDELLDAVESGSVRLLGDHVERVATNSLLLLLSAAESARRGQVSLSVAQPSVPLLAAIDRLGLTERFAPILEGTN